MPVRSICAVHRRTELPHEKDKDEAECQARSCHLRGAHWRSAREDDAPRLVLERRLPPLKLRRELSGLYKMKSKIKSK